MQNFTTKRSAVWESSLSVTLSYYIGCLWTMIVELSVFSQN